MTDVDDLATWLRAQLDARERELDEDEGMARDATQGDWHWVDPGGRVKLALVAGAYDHGWCTVVPVHGEMVTRHDADHIARHDPTRTLREVKIGRAEVDAKRRIIDSMAQFLDDRGGWRWFQGSESEAMAVIKLLAQPFAGREGWQEEWRA